MDLAIRRPASLTPSRPGVHQGRGPGGTAVESGPAGADPGRHPSPQAALTERR